MPSRFLPLLLGVAALLAISGAASAQTPFLGEIDLVAFNFAPQGWAFCDGQLVAIQQNTALFSLLGTNFGGDGITTFALPDLRGRRAIGQGQGPGLQNYDVGQAGGEETVTLTLNQIPVHSHSFAASGAPGGSKGPGGNFWGSASQVNLYSTPGHGPANMAPQAIGATGVGGPHDNMPPYLVMNYIIALQGIFPSRP